MTELVLASIPLAELIERITRSVEKELSKLPKESREELLDRKETAALLRITLPTLREYTRSRVVKGYRLGTRIRYKRSEVMAALKPLNSEGEVDPV